MTHPLVALLVCGSLAVGCGARSLLDEWGGGASSGDGGQGSGGSPPAIQVTSPDIDLLIVIDNSIGMSTKHPQLAAHVEQVVRGLVAPPCVDAGGNLTPPSSGACAPGTSRAFAPIRSIHLGIISSSLGSLTAESCEVEGAIDADGGARFLTRGADGNPVETEGGLGYLAFDGTTGETPDDLIAKAQEIILSAGELGCGWEMPLEAMTRFLVEPNPYQSLSRVDNYLSLDGTDELLLQQRAAFLRPTSSVAVVMLSDENDCSIDVRGQGFLVLRTEPFYRATSWCFGDPDSECCTSCALPLPECANEGCDGPNGSTYTLEEDPLGLRCWDQKRRYGVDFQYPTERYVNALSLKTIDPEEASFAGAGASTPNPLFAGGRDPSQVTLLAFGGVPWQDLASSPFDSASRYRTAAELEAAGSWDWVTGKTPLDPFMVEANQERAGTNPALGEPVVEPNSINLGDRPIPLHDFLEYACVFPLDQAIPEGPACGSCGPDGCNNPVCDGSLQTWGFAYPQLRQLEVARGLGDRGVAASICRSEGDTSASDALTFRLSQTLDP